MANQPSSPLSSILDAFSSPIRARYTSSTLQNRSQGLSEIQLQSSPFGTPISPIRHSNLTQNPLIIPYTPHRGRPRSNSDFTQSTPRTRVNQTTFPQELSPLQLTPGFVLEPPLRGTAAEKKIARVKEGHVKQKQTIAEKFAAAEEEHRAAAEAELSMKHETFHRCLDLLRSRGTTFGEFVMYVLDPESKQGVARWHEFASVSGRVTQILDWWKSTRSPPSLRSELKEWTLQYVCSLLGKQARHITRSGRLKTWGRDINEDLIKSFSFSKLYDYFRDEADIILRVFESITKTINTPTHSVARKSQGKTV